jgi:hypothetical protein
LGLVDPGIPKIPAADPAGIIFGNNDWEQPSEYKDFKEQFGRPLPAARWTTGEVSNSNLQY